MAAKTDVLNALTLLENQKYIELVDPINKEYYDLHAEKNKLENKELQAVKDKMNKEASRLNIYITGMYHMEDFKFSKKVGDLKKRCEELNKTLKEKESRLRKDFDNARIKIGLEGCSPEVMELIKKLQNM